MTDQIISGDWKLGFIGVGNMGGAMISGILRKNILPPERIGAYDADAVKLDALKSAGHTVYDGIPELVADCDVIVLSVKPQIFRQVLPEVAKTATADKVLVSIAAGISAKVIKEAMGFDCKIILAMPNTPLLLGHGATALSRVEPATQEDFDRVRSLFDAAGVTGEVPAGKMNEIIPVNGSSPAFVYLFAKAVTETAENYGIDGETAMRLFCQTLIGSAHMLLESGMTPGELVKMVCSPGGTTLEGVRALEDKGFSGTIKSAMNACVLRAEELSAAQ